MKYTVRPISDRTAFTGQHEPTPFRASWRDTLELLGYELDLLSARDVVLEVDVTEGDVRLDGMLRANARVGHPGVRIAFESSVGPLVYATDRYEARWSEQASWQQNVRAIALGLEALRKVDRYGITKRGEQYTGFKALGAGRAMPASHMTADDAAALLERVAIGNEGQSREMAVARILASSEVARDTWRHARAMAHPDRRGGDRTVWDQVEQAAVVLGVTR
ncbi:hypothetical protein [Nocardioides zeae]